MRIVVIGLGKVGRALTAQLTAENNDIVVIDQNPDLIEDIVNIYDVRGVPGNGGSYEVQKEAFEDGADLLIATTSSDEINILACLVAKKLGTQHTIARIRNPEYEKQLRFMRDELGLSMIINPERPPPARIARVLRFPSAIKPRASFCRQRFELIEYRLTEDNPLVGLQLADLYRNIRVKILICAVARGSETIIPTGAFTLQAGDKIYLTASARDLESFFRRLNLFKEKANNVMIVGASGWPTTSSRSCRTSRSASPSSTAMRPLPGNEREVPRRAGHPRGRRGRRAAERGAHHRDGRLCGADRPGRNKHHSGDVRSQINSCKVVAKINRESFAELAAAKGMVDSVVSTASVTSESIAMYVRAMQNSFESENIKTLHRLVAAGSRHWSSMWPRACPSSVCRSRI